MKKAEMYSKWGTLHRDILSIIFGKLNLKDLKKGASRVCISWFLAAHNRTLWTTVDLEKLNRVEGRESLWNILLNIISDLFDCCQVHRSLTDITNFSRTSPKNLFFSYDSCIHEKDLMFAAARMPNIEKLVLPRWSYHHNKNTFRYAFSTWKNLKTLIVGHRYEYSDTFDFQAVGENCSNLINLKFLGFLSKDEADQIVRYLQSIKSLSLRGSLATNRRVLLSLITGLQNLTILNLSHFRKFDLYGDPVRIDDILQDDATKKLDKFIICSQDCRLCKDYRRMSVFWSKHWKNDEIHELEF